MADIIHVSSLSLKDAFTKGDEERKLKGKVVKDNEKYTAYCDSIIKADAAGAKISADDPDIPYSYHGMMVYWQTDTFEGKEAVDNFVEVVKPFDDLLFLEDLEGNLMTQLIVHDIYHK